MPVLNRAVAAVTALGLLTMGLLVAVEIVVAGFGHRPWALPHDHWYRSARARSWDSGPARWLFAGLVAAGVLLLVLQVARRRRNGIALAPVGPPTDVARRGLERALVRDASRVDGVAAAKARVGPRRATVVATATTDRTAPIQTHLAAVVDRRLGALDLAEPPEVRVMVKVKPGPSAERVDT